MTSTDKNNNSNSSKQLDSFSLVYQEESKRSSKRIRDDSDSGNECDLIPSPPKRTRPLRKAAMRVCTAAIVKSKEMRRFFELAQDPVVSKFLRMDSCKRIADKYLLAMVFAYFKRAGYQLREFNRRNFFVALYLANDMEEDEEEFKYEIFPWALGYNWKNNYKEFWKKRDKLWKRIAYRAVVSKKCCDEIMSVQPGHWMWCRERPQHHGGAVRTHYDDEDSEDGYPRGPDSSPRICHDCTYLLHSDSQSPNAASWYLSSSASSSPDSGHPPCTKSTRVVSSKWLDMEVLRKTLATAENDIWIHKEE